VTECGFGHERSPLGMRRLHPAPYLGQLSVSFDATQQEILSSFQNLMRRLIASHKE
jgi:hypothetical protein